MPIIIEFFSSQVELWEKRTLTAQTHPRTSGLMSYGSCGILELLAHSKSHVTDRTTRYTTTLWQRPVKRRSVFTVERPPAAYFCN